MIKFVVFDFDGVFTNGNFYFEKSSVKKAYNSKDAYSLKILKEQNIKCGIITNDNIVSLEHAPHIFSRLDKISIGSEESKLNVLDKWLKEYNYSYDEVAYIGDDIPDIPILEKVGFSACPSDAIKEVREICRYICKHNGGNCAVREFVELIIQQNQTIKTMDNSGKITAVIPVRKGSTRCKHKNIRDFGNTNLLKLKIETLKKVEGIDKILVSSNCDIMLDIAEKMGVETYKREDKYCDNNNAVGFFRNLATSIDTNILMYCPVTSPLILHTDYEKAINIWNINKDKYDSLNTTTMIKEFIWNKNKPINYDHNKPIASQLLPDYEYLNFACSIIHKGTILKYNNIVGKNPLFIKYDNVKGVDIDTNLDFMIAESLYNKNIYNEEICKIIMDKRMKPLKLLDCTIRDGGYINNWNFSDEFVKDCYKTITQLGYDYFEIGFRTNPLLLSEKGKWCYSTEEDITNIYNDYNGCKIAVMAKIGTVTIDDFVDKSESNVSMVRVLLARTTTVDGINKSYYNEKDIKKSALFCEQLIKLGYEVCMNFACGDTITQKEIELIASNFHDIKINALYLADTYGSFNNKNIPKQYNKFYEEFSKYNSNIEFGFHCHNNKEDGLNKTLIALDHGCSYIDSCINGLGRGAGNLKTEQLISHLQCKNKDYINIIKPLVKFFDKYILSKDNYNKNMVIQSHPYYIISGTIGLHPNYIMELLNMNTTTDIDIDIINKLNIYTKERNEEYYNNKLIKQIYK